MKPKITSIGYAVPANYYTQAEVFASLDYPHGFYRIFRDSDIEGRHFILPLEIVKSLSFQEQQENYLALAPTLSMQAINECLDGRRPQDIGLVIFASCTGMAPGPTIAHYIGRELHLPPEVYYTNISAQGCEGAFPGIRRAFDFTKTTGKQSLLVNCELSSLTFWPEEPKLEPENNYEVARANAIFSDGASACLVGTDDDDWHHPEIIGMETHTNFDYMNDLGYVWRNGRLRVKLSKRVPELAPLVVKPALMAALEHNSLAIKDIQHWVIHAAGKSVLDNIRDAIEIPEEKVSLSRETLRLFGNVSSVSVGITGKRLMEKDFKPGDYVAILSIGPGITGGCVLCRF